MFEERSPAEEMRLLTESLDGPSHEEEGDDFAFLRELGSRKHRLDEQNRNRASKGGISILGLAWRFRNRRVPRADRIKKDIWKAMRRRFGLGSRFRRPVPVAWPAVLRVLVQMGYATDFVLDIAELWRRQNRRQWSELVDLTRKLATARGKKRREHLRGLLERLDAFFDFVARTVALLGGPDSVDNSGYHDMEDMYGASPVELAWSKRALRTAPGLSGRSFGSRRQPRTPAAPGGTP